VKNIKRFAAITVLAGGLGLAAAGVASADAGAGATSVGNSGVLSGNQVQVPINVPVNACGNNVSVLGGLNTAVGTACVNR
jgi:hypothetical protein